MKRDGAFRIKKKNPFFPFLEKTLSQFHTILLKILSIFLLHPASSLVICECNPYEEVLPLQTSFLLLFRFGRNIFIRERRNYLQPAVLH